MPPRKSATKTAQAKKVDKTIVNRRRKARDSATDNTFRARTALGATKKAANPAKGQAAKSSAATKVSKDPRLLLPKKRLGKYFEGYDEYYNFPQPTGPSIYFNSAEFKKGGAQAVFSNFHMAGFYVGSLYYHSAQHFYQDHKAVMIEKDQGEETSLSSRSGSRGPVLPETLNAANLRLFLHSVSAPSTHAAATRLFVMDGELKAAWQDWKPMALLSAVRHKFLNCPEERKYLLGTGSRELVEASPSDKECGVGYPPEKAERMRAKWGKNMLGMALMHVRQELRLALARDESWVDREDIKVGVHHLELKKPSVAFQPSMFDVPDMPTCEQQHQAAIADIRKQMESETHHIPTGPEVTFNSNTVADKSLSHANELRPLEIKDP
ncbi:hypothetical protein KC354_g8476 [Hortaea werneckii]|nr:hypothetical protein KC354_g8476 [Hortaea werneckii]